MSSCVSMWCRKVQQWYYYRTILFHESESVIILSRSLPEFRFSWFGALLFSFNHHHEIRTSHDAAGSDSSCGATCGFLARLTSCGISEC